MEWSAPKVAVLAAAVFGVALGYAGMVVPTDAAGRVIVAVAAVGLLGLATLGGLRRPRLAVSLDEGRPQLAVRGITGTKRYAQSDIAQIRLTDSRRIGRKTPMLEIDVTDRSGLERLLVFSRWDLGVHPEDVLHALTAHGLVPPRQ